MKQARRTTQTVQVETPSRPTEEQFRYMDIYMRLRKGYYRTTLTVAEKPTHPVMLGASATPDDHREYANKLDEYGKAYRAWVESLEAVRRDQTQLDTRFYVDMRDDLDYDGTDSFAQLLESQAYERGHSAGLGEVYLYMRSLMPLWEAYKKVRDERDRLREENLLPA